MSTIRSGEKNDGGIAPAYRVVLSDARMKSIERTRTRGIEDVEPASAAGSSRSNGDDFCAMRRPA